MCQGHYDRWRDRTPARIAYKEKYRPIRSAANREYKKQWQKNFRKTAGYLEYKKRYYSREDVVERLRVYRKSEKSKSCQRAARLKAEYGITPQGYDVLLAGQNGACAVCGVVPRAGKRLHIDHDHKTGRVRGPLCSQDNHALGLLKEDPPRIRKLAAYAEAHNAP